LEGEVRIEPVAADAVKVIGRVGKAVVRGETGRILAAAGAWERTSEDVHADHDRRRNEKDAVRQAEADRYDDWLRDVLAGEPVVVDVIEGQAESAGLRWRPDRNHPGASVSEAAARLRAFAVVPSDTRDSSGAWRWTLQGVDGYVAVGSNTMAGMR
jgi:hypothetical protein